MAIDKFSNIRSHIKIHPPFYANQYSNVYKNDPLWHSIFLLSHILEIFSSIAVPCIPTALDESGIRWKTQTTERSYSPDKPDKYSIMFYSVVGYKYKYLFSFMDMGVKKIKITDGYITPLEKYISVFPELRNPVHKIFNK